MSLRNRVIVLDFDGVVWDSVGESFEQAWLAWNQLHGGVGFAHDEAERIFRDARWQCKDGHDFYIVMSLMRDGVTDIGGLSADDFRRQRETLAREDEAERFVHAFYASREHMRTHAFERWCALQRPFPGVVDQINALRAEAKGVAVATTKDAPSALALLAHAGIDGLPVYGREVSLDKNDHMRAIQAEFGVTGHDMAFVEDLLENLRNVAAQGLRLVLADWGYNTAAERDQARAEGITVVSLNDFAARMRTLWSD